MIFVTVGTQLPFDRLIRTVDDWAARTGRTDVFAQIGPSDYKPQHVQFSQFITAPECRAKIEEASVIIAHAGMGSIISALERGKPLIVMPRRGDFDEHRNNHQVSTARKFLEQGSINVAMDETELSDRLNNLDSITSKKVLGAHASPQLIQTLSDFVLRGKIPGRVIVSPPTPIPMTASELRPAGQSYR